MRNTSVFSQRCPLSRTHALFALTLIFLPGLALAEQIGEPGEVSDEVASMFATLAAAAP